MKLEGAMKPYLFTYLSFITKFVRLNNTKKNVIMWDYLYYAKFFV